jgi:acyl-CoA dehydrogenase
VSDQTEVTSMLAEQLDRVFTRLVTHDVLTQAETGVLPKGLWDELEAMGVGHALVPEVAGGVGLAWADAEVILRAIGAHAAPVPLGETLLGRWAIADAGLDVPEGALAVSTERFLLDAEGRVSGKDSRVPWLEQAENVVVVAARGAESFVCVLRSDSARGDRAMTRTVGRIPGAGVELQGVIPDQCGPAGKHLGPLGLLAPLAVLRAAQMTGALDRILALCIDYGNTRVQFGKPIGKFQAIQHLIAEMAELSAFAQVAAGFGCRLLDTGDAEYGAAVAKIRTGQSAGRCAAIAHAVFGAMGVTDEHVLHFFTRRLWQWRDEAGSEHWWAERLGRRVIADGGQALWERLVA